MNSIKKIILLGSSFFLMSSIWVYADVSKGLVAIQEKDYAVAYKEFLSAAEQGNASAQYNLGVMY
ncbi:MAG: sel1 repeat family protein, partial [Emcibacter sp.]|nr:sel1 repeat family protein [Emcibacter sp.]